MNAFRREKKTSVCLANWEVHGFGATPWPQHEHMGSPMFLEVCQNCPVTPVCDTERAYVDACVTRSADSLQEKTYPLGMCVCVCVYLGMCASWATRLSTSTFVQVVECVHLLKRSRLNALVHFKICMLKKKNPWSSESLDWAQRRVTGGFKNWRYVHVWR